MTGKRGRPPIAREIVDRAIALRREGRSWSQIARELGLGRTTVRRLCLYSPDGKERPGGRP